MVDESEEQRESVPAAVRFLDAFFQERNIKWMLGIGTLILLGSSTMLVVSHWESYTPLWKSLILFGYTAAIHVTGQFTFRRLSLRRTGVALMALTVLLIPLGFFAVRWVHPEGLTLSAIFSQFGMLALLSANAAFAWFAATTIFSLLLRRTQPTLVASYLLLAAAGAIVPSLPAAFAPLTALTLWSVFAAGSIKANRHVFYLMEELRLPRIFGFFPIILLGTQYLLLFVFGVAVHLSWSWIGFGLVLTAVPILLTANTLADVFEKRNVGFEVPYPSSIAAPVVIGLCLIAAGVCLSAVGYPSTVALVPTAVFAAGMLAATAVRTRHSGFVWGSLILAAVAYQTSPVFFQGLARAVVQEGAAAVNESRLPLAFYGLTYLPWLLITTTLAWVFGKRNLPWLATPVRRFSIAVPVLLLLAAATHAKAAFPVGTALTALIGFQLFLFAQPGLVVPLLMGILLATAGMPTFVTEVLGVANIPELQWLCWPVTAILLLGPGTWLDRYVGRLAPDSDDASFERTPAHFTSLAIMLIASACWLWECLTGVPQILTGGACLALTFAHAFRWRNEGLGTVAAAFLIAFSLAWAHVVDWGFTARFTLVTVLTAVLSAGSRGLEANPRSTPSLVFARPASWVASLGVALALVVLIPWMALSPWPYSPLTPQRFDGWIAVGLALVTAGELAWRTSRPGLPTLSWLALLTLASLLTRNQLGFAEGAELTPLVWAVMACGLIPVVKLCGLATVQSPAAPSSETGPLRRWAVRELEGGLALTLIGIATLGIPVLTGTLRIAGLISLAGAFWLSRRSGIPSLSTLLLALANIQGLVFVVQLRLPELEHLGHLTPSGFMAAAIPLALAGAASAIGWERRRLHRGLDIGLESVLLQVFSAICLLVHVGSGNSISVFETVLATATLATFAGLHAWLAILATPAKAENASDATQWDRATTHVWTALSAAALGVLFLGHHGVLPFGSTWGLFVPLGLACVAYGLHAGAAGNERFRVFVEPMKRTALALPVLTVYLAGRRHLSQPHPEWLGLNSLAVLMASGFYFWRGLESRRPEALFGSAAILNLGMAMFWRELRWSDPQLFMVPLGASILVLVELLRNRIPAEWHNPLRYAGALTILVSPTFHIVGGGWLPLLTLMVASVAVVLVAMGLRVKALMYTGTAFLVADLLAIVVRGSFDHPSLLWLAGILVGGGVIGLAAYCERHREKMLQRLRLLSAKLETWD